MRFQITIHESPYSQHTGAEFGTCDSDSQRLTVVSSASRTSQEGPRAYFDRGLVQMVLLVQELSQVLVHELKDEGQTVVRVDHIV